MRAFKGKGIADAGKPNMRIPSKGHERPTLTIHGHNATQYTQRFIRELLAEVGVLAQIGTWPPPLIPKLPRIVLSPQTVPRLVKYRTLGFQMENNGLGGELNVGVLKSLRRLAFSYDYSETNTYRVLGAFPALGNKIQYWPVVPLSFTHDREMRELQNIASSSERDIPWLFVGSLNERRKFALETFEKVEGGVKVTSAFGQELWKLIIRAKVIVDVAYYLDGNLDVERFSMVTALGASYIGEASVDWESYPANKSMRHYPSGAWETGAVMVNRILNQPQISNSRINPVLASLPTARHILEDHRWSDPLHRLLEYLGK